jgi:hypothetical protein
MQRIEELYTYLFTFRLLRFEHSHDDTNGGLTQVSILIQYIIHTHNRVRVVISKNAIVFVPGLG